MKKVCSPRISRCRARVSIRQAEREGGETASRDRRRGSPRVGRSSSSLPSSSRSCLPAPRAFAGDCARVAPDSRPGRSCWRCDSIPRRQLRRSPAASPALNGRTSPTRSDSPPLRVLSWRSASNMAWTPATQQSLTDGRERTGIQRAHRRLFGLVVLQNCLNRASASDAETPPTYLLLICLPRLHCWPLSRSTCQASMALVSMLQSTPLVIWLTVCDRMFARPRHPSELDSSWRAGCAAPGVAG